MTAAIDDTTVTVSAERLKQTQFELATLAYEARGGGRDAYGRSSLLSLLIVVQHELERCLILSSIVACSGNALEAGVTNVKPRALTRYFPTESPQLTLSSLRMSKWFSGLNVHGLIEQFNEALAQAKEETISFTATSFSELRRDESGQSALAMGWREVCAVGYKLLLAIDRQLASYDIQGVAEEASDLLSLLEKVVLGQWPLIDASGDVVMPDWSEQREFARIPVRSSAVLECRGREQNITLRDMSTTGLGFECVCGLKVGDLVIVKTSKALFLKGTVVWAKLDRAGIELTRPLHVDDPELQFLCEAIDGPNGTGSPERQHSNNESARQPNG